MIVVVDYNVGNIRSVCNAFRHIGCEAELSPEPRAIEDAAGIVLPSGADAVLMASITHFGNYIIKQMKECLTNRGIPVNL